MFSFCLCSIRSLHGVDATYVRATVKHQGEAVALQAGQELLLDYGARKTYPVPSDCFTNYGFVPEEYRV